MKKRFEELSSRSYSNGIYDFTEFLSPAEQNLLRSLHLSSPCTFCGGYGGAEKAIAVFGSEEICGYIFEPPISFIKIEPVSTKFSDKLAHRDFLGAIMSLGIRRSTFGDVIVHDNCGYVICLENIASYICDNLLSIRHTNISCTAIEALPEEAVPAPVESDFVVSSERLDSVISAIYKLSRSESKNLIEHEKVLIGGAPVLSAGSKPKENDIITVRGYGKFIYVGLEHETKKGRLRCMAKIYK